MSDQRIRRVAEADVPAVVELVHALADYEKAPEECVLTADQLRRTLFGPSPALFGHVAETGGEIAGFALWFLNFSTWKGTHGIYLEDLFVRPEHRGSGLGKALLRTLAEECVSRGYSRFEWWVLDWNEPSIDFYKSVGAVPMDEWTVFRLSGDALREFGS
ncbi:GNAT family N-acetyltransferase [Parasphingorhabdus pacifica]